MPKILQIIDVDSEGHKVRLDDGSVIRLPHNSYPQIGQEIEVQPDPEPELEPRKFINANDLGDLGR